MLDTKMRIEVDTDTEIVTIDGMAFSYDFFAAFTHPDPGRLYSFEQIDGVVVATVVSQGDNDA